MKKIVALVLLALGQWTCFAAENLDSVLSAAGADMVAPLEKGAILCILAFSAPTQDMSEYIQTQLTSKATETGVVKVVTRTHMDKVNRELDFQMTGLVSDETALSICQRLGATAIVFGQMKELDNKYTLELRMLDVETGAYILLRTYTVPRSSKAEQLLGRAAIYRKTALGVRVECNKNSLESIALGGGITFDYSFTRRLSGGIKVLASYDVANADAAVTTLEPLATVRLYAVSPSGEPSTGLYIEGQCGASIIFVDSQLHYAFDAGAAIGFRFGLDHFYIEPEIRGGYPYLFGAGVNLGVRF